MTTLLTLTSYHTFEKIKTKYLAKRKHNGLHAVCVRCVCLRCLVILCYRSLITRSLLLGCGTMGVAITAGVLASLDSRSLLNGLSSGQPKWESHTPGTSTPTNLADDEPTLPSRFIACVKRKESASRLREKFRAVVGGDAVEVTVGENASAVQQSDVILLWYARQHPFHSSYSPSFFSYVQLQTTGGAPDSQRGWDQGGFGGEVAHQHPYRCHHLTTL
jgi:hypothetical protein